MSFLPRNAVQKIYKSVYDLIVMPYKSFLVTCLSNDDKNKMEVRHTKFKKMFMSINTERKMLKEMKKENILVEPTSVVIDIENTTVLQKGKPKRKDVVTTATQFSIKKMFEKILQAPGNFEQIKQNLNNIENSNSISHFMKSNLWNKKINRLMISTSSNTEIMFLPFHLFFDDWQPDNMVGHHKQSTSLYGGYIQFPFLSYGTEGKLNNVFLCLLAKTKDKKKFRTNTILGKLVEEIMFLEIEGISFDFEGIVYNIKPVLGLLLGDNLALNEILGYVMSFSASHACRICLMPKTDAQKATSQIDSLLRSEKNYFEGLELEDPSRTGISSDSEFNKIKSFFVFENINQDLMHDLYEGAFNYDLCLILNYFINEANYFTLNDLNRRMNNFDYGYTAVGNIAGEIKSDHISENKLRMSASELLTFVTYFPCMIGDLIPIDDGYWEFVIIISKINNILLQTEFIMSDITYINNLVKQHHEFFVKHNFKLKPKHHFMTHYGHIIEEIGPLKPIWCMRFEQENRILKEYIKNSSNRRNAPLSICRKEQFRFAYHIRMKFESFNIKTIFGPSILCDPACYRLAKSVSNSPNFIKWVNYNGLKFEKNCVLCFRMDDGEPDLCIMEYCFITEHKNLFFIGKLLNTTSFNYHYNCYEVQKSENHSLQLHNINELKIVPTTLHVLKNGSYGVILKPFKKH